MEVCATIVLVPMTLAFGVEQTLWGKIHSKEVFFMSSEMVLVSNVNF